jgi:hypothetical protein
MRRMLTASFALAVVCLLTGAAQAGPWCAHLNTGLNDCTFNTYHQCMVALSGNGGYCSPNAIENQYRPIAGSRRGYLRAY